MGWWPCCCEGPCDCACGTDCSFAWEFNPVTPNRAAFRYEGASTGDTLLGDDDWTVALWIKNNICVPTAIPNGTVLQVWSDKTSGNNIEVSILIENGGAEIRVQIQMRDPVTGYDVHLPPHDRFVEIPDTANCVPLVVRWSRNIIIGSASRLRLTTEIGEDDDTYDQIGFEGFYNAELTNPITSFGASLGQVFDNQYGLPASGCVTDMKIYHRALTDVETDAVLDGNPPGGAPPTGPTHRWCALNPWRQDTIDIVGSADLTYIDESTPGYSWP